MHRARCLARRTEKGRAYGQITAKTVAVLEALLWTFHNAGSGLCFPGYEANRRGRGLRPLDRRRGRQRIGGRRPPDMGQSHQAGPRAVRRSARRRRVALAGYKDVERLRFR